MVPIVAVGEGGREPGGDLGHRLVLVLRQQSLEARMVPKRPPAPVEFPVKIKVVTWIHGHVARQQIDCFVIVAEESAHDRLVKRQLRLRIYLSSCPRGYQYTAGAVRQAGPGENSTHQHPRAMPRELAHGFRQERIPLLR